MGGGHLNDGVDHRHASKWRSQPESTVNLYMPLDCMSSWYFATPSLPPFFSIVSVMDEWDRLLFHQAQQLFMKALWMLCDLCHVKHDVMFTCFTANTLWHKWCNTWCHIYLFLTYVIWIMMSYLLVLMWMLYDICHVKNDVIFTCFTVNALWCKWCEACHIYLFYCECSMTYIMWSMMSYFLVLMWMPHDICHVKHDVILTCFIVNTLWHVWCKTWSNIYLFYHEWKPATTSHMKITIQDYNKMSTLSTTWLKWND